MATILRVRWALDKDSPRAHDADQPSGSSSGAHPSDRLLQHAVLAHSDTFAAAPARKAGPTKARECRQPDHHSMQHGRGSHASRPGTADNQPRGIHSRPSGAAAGPMLEQDPDLELAADLEDEPYKQHRSLSSDLAAFVLHFCNSSLTTKGQCHRSISGSFAVKHRPLVCMLQSDCR